MPMLADPSKKYLPYPTLPPFERTWPTKRAQKAPIWLSTDLRDGNQALANPMSNEAKHKLFDALVAAGFKQIEVAYPAASDLEVEFCRELIEGKRVPDDVSVQIITPCREDLLPRSIHCLAGAKHAIIHLYNAVSPLFRQVVFRNSEQQTIDLVVRAVQQVKELAAEHPETKYQLNYCLETFSQTEIEFAVKLGNAVIDAWGLPDEPVSCEEDKIMFNLAATVEMGPPNHYADMVEYFCQNIRNRYNLIVSIHPHNDRGTGIAATELALLAGGDRVEGCLLGNGERTGNVDLITLALNLYTQGISPNLDFSNLPALVKTVEECTSMDVPPRYPYAGELVFSAFAGTHQDAIKKGLDAQAKRWASGSEDEKYWAVPYIPIDCKDLGIDYSRLIRVSSQSGKAGASWVIKQSLGFDLPRQMQVAFYKVVQAASDSSGKEMTFDLVVDAFKDTYMPPSRISLQENWMVLPLSPGTDEPIPDGVYDSDSSSDDASSDRRVRFEGILKLENRSTVAISGDGPSSTDALLAALSRAFEVTLKPLSHTSHNFDDVSASATHASYFELDTGNTTQGSRWTVGTGNSLLSSRVEAIMNSINAHFSKGPLPGPRRVFRPRSGSPHISLSCIDVKTLRSGPGSPGPRSPSRSRLGYSNETPAV